MSVLPCNALMMTNNYPSPHRAYVLLSVQLFKLGSVHLAKPGFYLVVITSVIVYKLYMSSLADTTVSTHLYSYVYNVYWPSLKWPAPSEELTTGKTSH